MTTNRSHADYYCLWTQGGHTDTCGLVNLLEEEAEDEAVAVADLLI